MYVYVIRFQNDPAYVGKLSRKEGLAARRRNHFSDANLVGTDREKPMRCAREIRALLDQGFERDDFTFRIDTRFATEDEAIAYFEAQGYELWNERRGGAGRPSLDVAVDWTDPAIIALLGTDTDAAIAAKLGVSNSTVLIHRTAHGIEPFGHAFSAEEAYEIRRRFAHTPETTLVEVAREKGVRPDTVSKLIKGKSYRHVARVAVAMPATLELTASAV